MFLWDKIPSQLITPYFYYIEKGVMWNEYNGDFDILSRAFCIWQSTSCTHYPYYSYNKTDK